MIETDGESDRIAKDDASSDTDREYLAVTLEAMKTGEGFGSDPLDR